VCMLICIYFVNVLYGYMYVFQSMLVCSWLAVPLYILLHSLILFLTDDVACFLMGACICCCFFHIKLQGCAVQIHWAYASYAYMRCIYSECYLVWFIRCTLTYLLFMYIRSLSIWATSLFASPFYINLHFVILHTHFYCPSKGMCPRTLFLTYGPTIWHVFGGYRIHLIIIWQQLAFVHLPI